MKLRITVIAEVSVADLSHYEANSIQEAASNQLQWLNDGEISVADLLDDCITSVSIVGIEEPIPDTA